MVDNVEGVLKIRVINDGRSLEPGFELNKATGLGLSIVRTLVTTELDGTITMRAGQPDDFRVGRSRRSPTGHGHRRRSHRPRLTTRQIRCAGLDEDALAAGEAATQVAALVLGRATPDARVLVGLEGVLEAVALHRALTTDLLGAVDLHQCVARGAYREEQVGVGVTADGAPSPRVVSIRQRRDLKPEWSLVHSNARRRPGGLIDVDCERFHVRGNGR